jgi:hypothetical protein
MLAPRMLGGGMAVEDRGSGLRLGYGSVEPGGGCILALPLLRRSSCDAAVSALLGVPSS